MGVPRFYRWLSTRFPGAIGVLRPPWTWPSSPAMQQVETSKGDRDSRGTLGVDIRLDRQFACDQSVGLQPTCFPGGGSRDRHGEPSGDGRCIGLPVPFRVRGGENERPKWLDKEQDDQLGLTKHVMEEIKLQDAERFFCDNLYLDMNGIIHPCCHPEASSGLPFPECEDDMFGSIFAYVDRVVATIRPQRVLFMAIDGVAARAKLNQQRTRRYRSQHDAQESRRSKEALLNKVAAARGFDPRTSMLMNKDKDPAGNFDGNVITPGTPFMMRLRRALEYYVRCRISASPYWASLAVIVSDSGVPGEGEHRLWILYDDNSNLWLVMIGQMGPTLHIAP